MLDVRRNMLIICLMAGMMILCSAAWSTTDTYGASKGKPGKVASLSLTVTGQPMAQLQWKKATGNVNGYTVYRNGKVLVKLKGKSLTAYNDESLKPGKSYTYTVKPYYRSKKGKLTYGKASPAKKVIKGYSYKKVSGVATLTGYTGRDSIVTTPAKIAGLKVKKIGNGCFQGNVWIKRVRVTGGVTGLGDYSFEACGSLKTASLPESIRTIGDGAFNGCAQMRACDMPDGVTSIGKGAFLYCKRLTYADLPASLKGMGDFAFAGCENLKDVTFEGNKLTKIPDRAFYTCWSLTDIVIPESVTTIGKRAFSGCGKLAEVSIKGSSTTLGDYAFERCEDLKFDQQEGSLTIGFSEFSQLREDNEQKRIKDQWQAEDHYTFPDDTVFSEGAFFGSTVSGIINSGGLITDGPSFRNYVLEDGVLYSKDKKTLLAYFPSKLKEDSYEDEFTKTESAKTGVFTVPEGVERIAPYAFYRSGLTQVNVASTVKEIGEYAFTYSGMYESKLMIPSGSNVSVNEHAFDNWSIPVDVVEVGQTDGGTENSDQQTDASGGTQTGDQRTDADGGTQTDDQRTDADGGTETSGQQTSGGTQTGDQQTGGGTETGDQQTDTDSGSETGDDTDPGKEPVEAYSYKYESMANGGIFNEKKFSGYLNHDNDFTEWVKKYAKYNKNNVPMTAEAMPYIHMYTGEGHYRQMTSALNGDVYKTQQSISRSGDDYKEMYLMVDHGLITELTRGRMPGDIMIYSGITPERVSDMAGETEKGTGEISEAQRQKIIKRIGGEISDPAVMSTTASPRTAFEFSGGEFGSNTILQIYGSKKALDKLGAICVDDFSRISSEKEILFNANARYRILDVGTMSQYLSMIDPITNVVISTELSDQRTYVKVQLLEP